MHLPARNTITIGTLAAGVLALAMWAAPAWAQDQQPAKADPSADLTQLAGDPAQWPMAARSYDSNRFSPLDQINTGNVGKLQLAWSFSDGVDRGQESVPIVVDNTMYIVSPYPNQLFALDATTGALKWSYKVKPNYAAEGVACCDIVNRGAAYDNGKVFFNALDNYTVAVDAKTGKELWHAKLDDINTGSTMTMAPLVVHGKVIVGNSGNELGVRGWLTALDENTGKTVWRAYSAGPDKDVLIGSDFKPYYDWMKGKDLGVKTWPPDKWKIGGGGPWGWISYDPKLNLLFYGTGNPGPWNPNQRPGDNLWTATIFARDPDTGMAKWAYQTSPHDLWDHDGVNELVLTTLDIDGKPRDVIIRPDRTGYLLVIDRTSGEVISADPYDTVNAYKGVDMKSGRIIPNPDKPSEVDQTTTGICPASPGAKDWQPSAFSPKTQLIYVPHQHLCMDYRPSQVGYIAGTPYLGATVDMYAGPGDGYRGEFMAWDPVKRKKIWAIHERFPVWSGTVATAGNVVFYGTMDRWFKAVDATTGKPLWQFLAPSGFIGQPSVYRGSDGREYVAILSGVGGWPGVTANAELNPLVRNGALGFAGATQDLPAFTAGGSSLLVFALPADVAKAAAPASDAAAAAQPAPAAPPSPPAPPPAAPAPAPTQPATPPQPPAQGAPNAAAQ